MPSDITNDLKRALMNEEKKGPVKIGITASANAKLELKGRIPKKSLGRIADAIADAFSPFTEARGLRGDLLRLQREEVLLEIARRAKLRADLSDETRTAIPTKFMIPFLERASLEDIESELVDWWASLLAAAVSDVGIQHPIFPEILSRITPAEAKALNMISGQASRNELKQEELDFDGLYREVFPELAKSSDTTLPDEEVRSRLNNYRHLVSMNGGLVTYLADVDPRPPSFFDIRSEPAFEPLTANSSLDVLLSLGIIERTHRGYAVPSRLTRQIRLTTLSPTKVGRVLLRACLSK